MTKYPSCTLFSFAPELVFSITLTSTSTLTVQLTAQTYASALYVRTSCTGSSDLDCTVAGGPQTLVLPSLGPGTYYIVVDGDSSAEGAFNLVATIS